MRKYLLSSLIVASLFVGCATHKNQNIDFNQCNVDGGPTPEWVCNPNVKGTISAIGIAENNKADDYSMQLEEATADARDKLARQISVKVKNMFKKFKATTGYGKDATFEKATQSVSKQIAYEVLNGTKVIKSWKSPRTKRLYVLVVLENPAQRLKTALHNKEALWQKFLAKNADKELDKEIDKEFK